MDNKEVNIGIDVSKGTAEICFKNKEGRILLEGTFDDTPKGHARLRDKINSTLSL